MDWISIVYLSSCTFIMMMLFFASVSDLRYREIPDRYWAVIGAVGIMTNLICRIGEGGLVVLIGTAGEALFLIALLSDHGRMDFVLFGGSASLAVFAIFYGGLDPGVVCCALPSLFGIVFLALYWLGILRGGADTKCLIVTAMAVPVYPGWSTAEVPDLLNLVFAPSISMMFLASIMSVIGCSVYCSVKNARDGRFRINGFTLPACDVGSRFVWPMEDIENGKPVRCAIPDDGSIADICIRFEKAGVREMLVTPMVPFLVPLTVSFFLVVVFGSPFTLLC